MALPVADLSSNAEENIAHAAKILGRAKHRVRVFNAIYTGKRQIKTAREISTSTRLSEIRVLQEGKRLAANHLVNQTKIDGRTAYRKIDFFHHHKKQILALASSPRQLRAFPTKRNPAVYSATAGRIQIKVDIPRRRQRAYMLTVDNIGSFSNVRGVGKNQSYTRMAERKFKKGVAKILGETGNFKDWGGENRDLSSTRLVISGQRRAAAFAFKGPGKTGRLTPGKMGKNGDQIQRLFRCPADVFLVQYWAQVDDAVLEQMQGFAQLKSYMEGKPIGYGIIDGGDSTRLIKAYPNAFRN